METSTGKLRVRPLIFEEPLEILIFGAITIRVLVLCNRMKLYRQMNRHITETDIRLERLDKSISVLNHHILEVENNLKDT